MIRIASVAVIFAGLVLPGAVASAQGTSAENEDSRYTFNRADDGYLRLDGRTGHVSICTRRSVGWACQAVVRSWRWRCQSAPSLVVSPAPNRGVMRVTLGCLV